MTERQVPPKHLDNNNFQPANKKEQKVLLFRMKHAEIKMSVCRSNRKINLKKNQANYTIHTSAAMLYRDFRSKHLNPKFESVCFTNKNKRFNYSACEPHQLIKFNRTHQIVCFTQIICSSIVD